MTDDARDETTPDRPGRVPPLDDDPPEDILANDEAAATTLEPSRSDATSGNQHSFEDEDFAIDSAGNYHGVDQSL